ncbi:MAG: DUF1700 domain-containing protein [Clostridia bacterium]|nr:DUF1700 domain-containing protein [Clostridia bacterium]
MTYNEWRDELKSNLLCVSESERRRVLDYYAEAYADRRDAGFTEREIIDDFGAPYDAAQRILSERSDTEYFETPRDNKYGRESFGETKKSAREIKRENREEAKRLAEEAKRERLNAKHNPPPPPQPQYNDNYNNGQYNQNYPQPQSQKREDYTWIFVLLCIIFCVPLFGLIMTMVGITISVCVAPFGLLIGGIATIGGGIGAMISGHFASGLCSIGLGAILFGVSIVLFPLFTKIVSLMWTLFKKFFAWVKSLFSGKGVAV